MAGIYTVSQKKRGVELNCLR